MNEKRCDIDWEDGTDDLEEEVNGQEMDHLGICHHGKDLDGSMDEVHVGMEDINLQRVRRFRDIL